MKKKILGIALLLVALLVVLCLASCGGDNTTASSNPPAQSTPNSTPSTGDGETTESSKPSGEMVTIKFDTSKASGTIKIADQNVYIGGYVTEPSEVPYRKGDFVFFGWCVNGNKNQKWNFNTDVVTGPMTLSAEFDRTNSADTCAHNYVKDEEQSREPTCQASGLRVEKCSLCNNIKRTLPTEDESLMRLPHLEEVEIVEPTCAVDGYKHTYCPNGCGLDETTKIKATNKHEYADEGWYAAVQPTLYVEGIYENACIVCKGAIISKPAGIQAEYEHIYGENVNVSYTYTGGKYINQPMVSISDRGRVLATSYFDGTKPHYIIDKDEKTFWSADTYVDGANYSNDWIEIELAQAYDVGALRFVLPNYTNWELGEECYVSFDIEYWDAESQSWVFIQSISDKDATSIGISCEYMIVLDAPITTTKVRACVNHATRYAPATIYEVEVFAKAEDIERFPLNIAQTTTVSVSGKYNEWASGGAALLDNSTGSYWYTDARYNQRPWALMEFATEKYIACVQFAFDSTKNRTVKLELMIDGEWVDYGEYKAPGTNADGKYIVGGSVISNNSKACTFNVNVEKTISKIRLTVVNEPQYWSSYFYFVTPYTIIEQASWMEPTTTECGHKAPIAGEVIAPTCETTGYTVMNCYCGVSFKTASTDMLGHDFGKYTVETAATATSFGTKVSKCRNDGCNAISTMTYEEKYEAPTITTYLHGAPAAWAQSFDDGNYLSTYDWVIPQLEKYGYRATILMSITYTDSLVPNWVEYFKRGVFDLGSHSYNHEAVYSGEASPSTLLTEVVNAQYWFRHNYKGQQILAFAAPLGTTSDSVAKYLAGTFIGNRNGGDTMLFYNLVENLEKGRLVWGDLNSYISKSDQTEGDYVFVSSKNTNGTYHKIESQVDTGKTDKDGNPIFETQVRYEWVDKGSYDKDGTFHNDTSGAYAMYRNVHGEYVLAKKSANYVFVESQMTFVDLSSSELPEAEELKNGTYYYVAQDWRYDFKAEGSYNLVDGEFVFVNDNSGEYKLIKKTVGSYEKGVEELVKLGGFTVECLHSILENRGSVGGVIHSSYVSTISKYEHIKRFGVWAASYNDLMKYLKESQAATVTIVEHNDSTIVVSVTDSLDDYMFDQAITVKVDIPNNWTSVSVVQGDKEIPLVDYSDYKQSGNMYNVSCAINDGYLYVDIVPDRGNVVITVGDKNDGSEYDEKVTVTYEPYQGELKSYQYEAKVVIGGTIAAHPDLVVEGFYFRGWYVDEAFTILADESYIYNEDTILYAKLEPMPQCTDGSYNHSWSIWIPGGDHETRACNKCQAVETRDLEKNAE